MASVLPGPKCSVRTRAWVDAFTLLLAALGLVRAARPTSPVEAKNLSDAGISSTLQVPSAAALSDIGISSALQFSSAAAEASTRSRSEPAARPDAMEVGDTKAAGESSEAAAVREAAQQAGLVAEAARKVVAMATKAHVAEGPEERESAQAVEDDYGSEEDTQRARDDNHDPEGGLNVAGDLVNSKVDGGPNDMGNDIFVKPVETHMTDITSAEDQSQRVFKEFNAPYARSAAAAGEAQFAAED